MRELAAGPLQASQRLQYPPAAAPF